MYPARIDKCEKETTTKTALVKKYIYDEKEQERNKKNGRIETARGNIKC